MYTSLHNLRNPRWGFISSRQFQPQSGSSCNFTFFSFTLFSISNALSYNFQACCWNYLYLWIFLGTLWWYQFHRLASLFRGEWMRISPIWIFNLFVKSPLQELFTLSTRQEYAFWLCLTVMSSCKHGSQRSITNV